MKNLIVESNYLLCDHLTPSNIIMLYVVQLVLFVSMFVL